MFDKRYYSLEESAKKLGTDVKTLLHMEYEGQVQLCYIDIPTESSKLIKVTLKLEKQEYKQRLHYEFVKKVADDIIQSSNFDKDIEKFFDYIQSFGVYIRCTNSYKDKLYDSYNEFIADFAKILELNNDQLDELDDCIPFLYLTRDSSDDIPRFLIEILSPYTPYRIEKLNTVRSINKDNKVYIPKYILDDEKSWCDQEIGFRSASGLVITHKELTRLLALKAEQDNKPTYEQLQAENEALKKQLAEMQIKPTDRDIVNIKKGVYVLLKELELKGISMNGLLAYHFDGVDQTVKNPSGTSIGKALAKAREEGEKLMTDK